MVSVRGGGALDAVNKPTANDIKLKAGFDAGMAALDTDPEYLAWLHELTIAGYDRNITIPVEHADGVKGIYLLGRGDEITTCLNHYEDFTRRLKAISENPQ